jgi:hypothetical protein
MTSLFSAAPDSSPRAISAADSRAASGQKRHKSTPASLALGQKGAPNQANVKFSKTPTGKSQKAKLADEFDELG